MIRGIIEVSAFKYHIREATKPHTNSESQFHVIFLQHNGVILQVIKVLNLHHGLQVQHADLKEPVGIIFLISLRF